MGQRGQTPVSQNADGTPGSDPSVPREVVKMAKVKICGLRLERDIEYANSLKPDFIGYVFWQKSKRYVTY